MIAIIDNFDSFTFNLYQGIEALGYRCQVFRNDSITLRQLNDFAPDAVVISPGPGRPEHAGITLKAIHGLNPNTPILGVCLGHQAIGQAFGSRIVLLPKPHHGKISSVHHNGHALFHGLKNPFPAVRYHSLIIDKHDLPHCLKIIATTRDGTIMAIQHQRLPIYGVQFHPESYGTPKGIAILKNFFNLMGVHHEKCA